MRVTPRTTFVQGLQSNFGRCQATIHRRRIEFFVQMMESSISQNTVGTGLWERPAPIMM